MSKLWDYIFSFYIGEKILDFKMKFWYNKIEVKRMTTVTDLAA